MSYQPASAFRLPRHLVEASGVPFELLDAGEAREFLAGEFAEWYEAGFWPSPRIELFFSRVRLLAARIGVAPETVLGDIQDDASLLVGGAE